MKAFFSCAIYVILLLTLTVSCNSNNDPVKEEKATSAGLDEATKKELHTIYKSENDKDYEGLKKRIDSSYILLSSQLKTAQDSAAAWHNAGNSQFKILRNEIKHLTRIVYFLVIIVVLMAGLGWFKALQNKMKAKRLAIKNAEKAKETATEAIVIQDKT